jgi:hypothetical protein
MVSPIGGKIEGADTDSERGLGGTDLLSQAVHNSPANPAAKNTLKYFILKS